MKSLYPNIKTSVEIADYFFSQIKSGKLKAEDALPAVRQLADTLGVNPNTVASAYGTLRDAGAITTDGRRGSRIAAQPTTFDTGSRALEGLFDLSQGNIDPSLIPNLSAITGQKFEPMTGYDITGDLQGLLNKGGAWLTSQNIISDQLSVFSGALDAMEQALRAHTLPGDSVWVEDPCWPPILMLLGYLRLKPIPLLMDDEGCSLPADNTRASAVILTPRAQNPTGVSISKKRAKAWKKHLDAMPDCLLIIDDFWGPLTNTPFPNIITKHQCVYILSLSKFLGPDLRISLVSGIGRVPSEMRRQQLLGPRWVSHILQHTALQLWNHLDENQLLEDAIFAYQERRVVLLQQLPEDIANSQKDKEGAHLWIPVSSESLIVHNMAAKGWAIQEGQPFRKNSPSAVRISLGNIGPEHVEKLAKDLTEALKPSGWSRASRPVLA